MKKTIWIKNHEKYPSILILDLTELGDNPGKSEKGEYSETETLLRRMAMLTQTIINNQIVIMERMDKIEFCPIRTAFDKGDTDVDKETDASGKDH